MPVVAPELGTWTADSYSAGGDSYDVPLAFNTRPADLADLPAISLPCGRVEDLPVGLQLVGDRYDDWDLLAAARTVEALV
jgi:amidase/aspartyl-tRNA(Asn)/glutamyl-tRNA(Gln) amidotransferase subunit A